MHCIRNKGKEFIAQCMTAVVRDDTYRGQCSQLIEVAQDRTVRAL